MVSFEERNLAEDDPVLWQPDVFDIIFCRNVVMYFTPSQARALIARVERALAPGGFLFLGSAETLRGLSQAFHLRHTHGTFYYQRKSATEKTRTRSLNPQIGDASPFGRPPGRRTGDVQLVGRSDRNRLETYSEARATRVCFREPGRGDRNSADSSSLESEPRAGPAPEGAVCGGARMRERAAARVDSRPGRPAPARGAADSWRAACRGQEELLGPSRDRRAECRCTVPTCALLRGGRRPAGGDRSRSGVGLPRPRLCHAPPARGFAGRRSGDLEAARRELGQALVLLQREEASRVLLFGGGFSREGLLELCRAQLVSSGGLP